MIAPNASLQTFNLLTLGLAKDEEHILESMAASYGGRVDHATNDLDLWDLAQKKNYDACLLGQTAQSHDPCYLVWLLKGVIRKTKVILIYDSINHDDDERLRRIEAAHVLVRPVNGNELLKHLDLALHHQETRRSGFTEIVRRLMPSNLLSRRG